MSAFGTTELFYYAVSLLAIAAAVADLFWGRIFNWITVPALVIGILVSFILGGASVGFSACLGVFAGLILYGSMFWFGILGGGDVKLLMALGAWGGIRYVEEVSITAILVGGVMAIFILLFKGRLSDFIRRMRKFALILAVKELEFQAPEIDSKQKMPFGVPMAIAALWVLRAHPLEKWGMPLWP